MTIRTETLVFSPRHAALLTTLAVAAALAVTVRANVPQRVAPPPDHRAALSLVFADQGNRALQGIRADVRAQIRAWRLPELPAPAPAPTELAQDVHAPSPT